MGRRLPLLLAIGVGSGATALAEPKKPPDEVDVRSYKAELVFLHDGRGHYLALVPLRSETPLFYGDGKTFHEQRVFGYSQDGGQGSESRNFWAPTSVPRGAGEIRLREGKWVLQCADRKTPLVAADEADRRKILGKAVFKRPLWKRQAAALGRDDDGVYYFVDKIRDDRGRQEQWEDPHPPTGYRLFVGRKGSLKAQRITDTTIDSKGFVLTTSRFNVTVDEAGKRMVRSKASTRDELSYLPVEDNLLLVYRDLGVYGKLGVPCDAM